MRIGPPAYWWALWQTIVSAPVDSRLLGIRGRIGLRELRRRGLVTVDGDGWIRKA